jgi:hypothetical protein
VRVGLVVCVEVAVSGTVVRVGSAVSEAVGKGVSLGSRVSDGGKVLRGMDFVG